MKSFQKLAGIGLLCCMLLPSCISRLSRPEINGVILDYEGRPIADCKVGETVTDKEGRFRLPEQRYKKFFLTEFFAMEAPPLFIDEPLEKEGFEKDRIKSFQPRGGGQAKGATADIDTIFLKRLNQQFDLLALLKNSRWNMGFNKTNDTLSFVKEGFTAWCKTERCSPFYRKYLEFTDGYFSGSNNLPDGMIRRLIEIDFNDRQQFKMRVAQEYLSTFDGPNKKPDTLNTSGSVKLVGKTKVQLNIDNMKNLSGIFDLAETDLYQVKLTKTR